MFVSVKSVQDANIKQQLRTRFNLLLEELWMITSTASGSSAKQTAAHHRLNGLHGAIMDVSGQVINSSFFSNMTEVEEHLCRATSSMIHLVRWACNSATKPGEQLSTSMADNCFFAGRALHRISDFLEQTIAPDDDDDWAPLFINTLHPLYVAHEAGTIAIAVADYLTHKNVWTHKETPQFAKQLKAIGTDLRKLVHEKAVEVRKHLNEKSWLDFVVNGVSAENESAGFAYTPESPDIKARSSENTESRLFDENELPILPRLQVGPMISETVGDDFIEHWAGEIIDSWRESSMGLVCLKAD